MPARNCQSFGSPLLIAAIIGAASGHVCAQIATDGTLGAAGPLAGPNFAITSDLGRQVGTNLFHSFSGFNLASGQSATFSGPAGIGNIISRVTGGSSSSIDGLLRSTIAGANLFLVNPKGLMFGPNARLDLTGSFYASSADYVRLGVGGRFDASNPAASVLTAAAPEAFGFLGPTPAPIAINGSQLTPSAGGGIALIGGPVTINAQLLVNGGLIRTLGADLRIAAVASAGEISTDAAATSTPGMSFANVSMSGAQIRSNSSGSQGPGRLVIRGGNISMVNGVVRSQNASNADAAPLDIVATGNIDLSNMQLISTATLGGHGATASIGGNNFLANHFTRFTTSASGAGTAGDFNLQARGSLTLAATPTDPGLSFVSGATTGAAAGGTLRLSGDIVKIDGATIRTSTSRAGNAGAIEITAREIDLTGGAFVYSQTRAGSTGRGGDIRLVATGSTALSGLDGNGFGTFVQSDTAGSGPGGAISIRSGAIDVAAGAIVAQSFSAGAGGAITLDADTIRLRDSQGFVGQIQTRTGPSSSGNAGALTLRGRDSITVEGWGMTANAPGDYGSSISTTAEGSGRAGDLTLDAPRILIERGANVASFSFGPGVPGNVTVRGHDIDLRSGGIMSNQSPGSSVAAGNLRIEGTGTLAIGTLPASPAPPGGRNPPESVVDSQSRITATTQGEGNAGAITIDIPTILLGRFALIASGNGVGFTSPNANAGDVSINARTIIAEGATIRTSTPTRGNSGGIRVQSDDLYLLGGSTILSVAEPGSSGAAGAIKLEIKGRLEIVGAAVTDPVFFQAGVSAGTGGSGPAGDVSVLAGQLLIDRGFIAASTLGAGAAGNVTVQATTIDIVHGGGITASAQTGSTGTAGNVTVTAAGRVSVRGFDDSAQAIAVSSDGGPLPSGIISRTFGAGAAGDVRVRAPLIRIGDGGFISTASRSAARAGSISIIASDALEIFNGGAITTTALSSDGGNITIQAGNRVHLANSSINTSVGSGSGAGGNIFIDPVFVILDNSSIIANAFGGPGGNISIISDYFLSSPGSRVEASSQLGVSGNVQVAAPRTDPGAALARLPAALFDASGLLSASCSGRAGPGASSLVAVGRGGLAASPSGDSGSRYFQADAPAVAALNFTAPLVMAAGTVPGSVLLASLCGQ